jgi:hypothetical protein
VKKLLLVALLLGGGYFAYRYFIGAAQARCYEQLADAWARGRTDEALQYSEGDEVRRSLERHPMTSLVDARMIEALHGIRSTVESSTLRADGQVAIEAKQTIAFDPPGATSAIGGALIMFFHHSARLRKTDDGWKVVAFEPTFIEMRAIRRH